MNLYDFKLWYERQINQSWKYLKDNNSYYFVFSYSKIYFITENLQYLKPIFPWKSHIILNLIQTISNERRVMDLLEEQEKKIKNQERIIKKLKKKKNNSTL